MMSLPFPRKAHRHTLRRQSRPRAPHSESALQHHGSGNPIRPVESQHGRFWMETEKLKLAVLFQLEWRLKFIEGGLVAHLPSWGTALMVLERESERERERKILVTGLWNFWMIQRIQSICWFSIWDPSRGLCHYVLRRAMVSQKPKGIAEPHSWRLEVGELRSITGIECMIVPVSSKSHSMNVL